jgi:hypothetical protein
MCVATVVWRPLKAQWAWLAMRWPRWNTSTVLRVMRTPTCARACWHGTE